MNGQDDRLCLNAEEVAAKVMDGEAIIINFSNGMYYSMDGVGGLVWELVEAGHSVQEIAASVTRHYDVPLAQAAIDVQRLATELVDEKLLLVADGSSKPAVPPDREPPTAKLPYQSPTLNAYRDMGDLLALDPPMPGLEDIPWEGAPGRVVG